MAKNKIKHLYTFLCENVIQSSENKFSYINVMHNIRLEAIPGALTHLFITSSYTGGEGEPFNIAIEAPGRKELLRSQEMVIAPTKSEKVSEYSWPVAHGVIIIQPAIFYMEGIHSVAVRVGGKVIHREQFGVYVLPEAKG